MRMPHWGKVASILGVAGAAAGYSRFRGEMKASWDRLEAGSQIGETQSGPIEFAREGRGEPVLMIHGAGGGYDQGLFVSRDLFGANYDSIAPSRFGYLRTPVAEDCSPAAQADAHAALLDALGIDRAIVVGVSAGGPSAVEMALRHPDRVSSLILLVPRLYDPSNAVGVQRSASNEAVLAVIEKAADFAFWLMLRLARRAVVRFLGVPPELEAKASAEDRARMTALMRSLLPLSKRAAGLRVDSRTELAEWPLHKIQVPTLIVTAKDDLFRTLPGARFTADRISGAELLVLESGGHMMLGRRGQVREAIDRVLRRRPALESAA